MTHQIWCWWELDPTNCIDLIVTDPPYFRVKSCAWDNQWANEAEYLAWLDDVLTEFWRVLKPNGSLYLFCGSKLAFDTELLVKRRFNMIHLIVLFIYPSRWAEELIE
ncbi:hypothetical protein GWJ07_20410 [Proteus sp. G2639]|nr:hypothetical protein [Proteus sp. G2639]